MEKLWKTMNRMNNMHAMEKMYINVSENMVYGIPIKLHVSWEKMMDMMVIKYWISRYAHMKMEFLKMVHEPLVIPSSLC